MKYIFFIAWLLIGLPGTAQNLKSFYVQTVHPDGLLYFVFPRKMPEAKNGKAVSRAPLQYDYTYLDASDSVTVLLTVVTGPVFKCDSLCIGFASGEQKKAAASPIYCKPVKHGWESRIRSRLHRNDWEQLYQAEQPFTFTLSSAESDLRLRFGDQPRKWPQIRTRFVRLQEVIRLNKEKN
ncbi:MAG: hypothetical protein LIP00_00885 [Parabacteroides sp.]|nr:hypothetical protein [Parabacteroides sp.]